VSKGWASSSSRDLWGGDAFHRRCWKTKSPTHPLVEAVKKHMRALSLQYDDEAAAIASGGERCLFHVPSTLRVLPPTR
jgi:hypothetical protein